MNATVKISWWQVLGVLVVALVVWWAVPAGSQTAAPQPVSSFAFVARADNPVDALAASSVAGQLGAPVYLTGSDTLDDQARQGLTDTDPQVVVLAGGTAALSVTVEQQIGELLPDAQVRRFAGAGRTETARLVNTLTGELGIDRPVLAGGTVTGNVGIDGNLTLDGADVAGALSELTARVGALESGSGSGDDNRIDQLEADLAAATGRIGALQTNLDSAEGQIGTLQTDLDAAEGRIGTLEGTLAGVSRTGDTLQFAGMNLQIVNGQDATATSNSLGNVIIGYNEQRTTAASRTGSHYLVVGDRHEWTAFGGLLAGFNNTATGGYASVSGGIGNTASGGSASVSGGGSNTADGFRASVSGGDTNTATGGYASVSGGIRNNADGNQASVSGGGFNNAGGEGASVSGGLSNTAAGLWTSVVGGRGGTVLDSYDSLIGDTPFVDS